MALSLRPTLAPLQRGSMPSGATPCLLHALALLAHRVYST